MFGSILLYPAERSESKRLDQLIRRATAAEGLFHEDVSQLSLEENAQEEGRNQYAIRREGLSRQRELTKYG